MTPNQRWLAVAAEPGSPISNTNVPLGQLAAPGPGGPHEPPKGDAPRVGSTCSGRMTSQCVGGGASPLAVGPVAADHLARIVVVAALDGRSGPLIGAQ